jgi:transcriptional regulator with XRE-family HTH domain
MLLYIYKKEVEKMEKGKNASCAKRLTLALAMRNLKQTDLCARTGIPKSAMSQYVNGSFEPKQDRIFLMAKALDVSEAWLMGYDVPMEKEKLPTEENLTDGEKVMLELFRQVPEEDQRMLLDMIKVALSNRK